MQEDLRSLISEPSCIGWYNGGSELAVDLAKALVLLHQQHQVSSRHPGLQAATMA